MWKGTRSSWQTYSSRRESLCNLRIRLVVQFITQSKYVHKNLFLKNHIPKHQPINPCAGDLVGLINIAYVRSVKEELNIGYSIWRERERGGGVANEKWGSVLYLMILFPQKHNT